MLRSKAHGLFLEAPDLKVNRTASGDFTGNRRARLERLELPTRRLAASWPLGKPGLASFQRSSNLLYFFAGPLSASSYYRLAGLFRVSANSTAFSAALIASGSLDWKIHSRAGTLIGGRSRIRAFSID
jgi:hypothetical protein